ncbi:MAG: dihydrofolate reductase family protein [Candidatus Gottesmanbacteria bacterium]|nr:dihydrofolate reductase family protein [Candidatus Gottesmanbacteria bacterium]
MIVGSYGLKAPGQTAVSFTGEKTYEIIKTWGQEYLDDLKGIKVIIVSTNNKFEVGEGFTLAQSPQDALAQARHFGVKCVTLTGGSHINSSFAKLGLIDEVILNVEPVIIGEGIPLFAPTFFDLKLELLSMTQSKGKTIQLHYKVVK